MIMNYFKIAFRNLTRNKVFSIITIIGLTVGLWACFMVSTVVVDDLSYDQHWTKKNEVYRLLTLSKIAEGVDNKSSSSLSGVAPELKKNFPEVEDYSELYTNEIDFKPKDNSDDHVKTLVLSADSSVWNLLDIKVIAGNPMKYVSGSRNLVISESYKEKYFKGIDPVGKTIKDLPSYQPDANEYLITGVMKDIPANTFLRADVLFVHKKKADELNKSQFGTFKTFFVLMKPGVNMAMFTQKVNHWYAGFVKVPLPDSFEFQPINQVYLHSDFAKYQEIKGNIRTIYIFSGVAILLLLIACVNFINISTARAFTRMKEMGVRKVLGAPRKQLIQQFLVESIQFFIISTVLALTIYQFSLNPLERFLGHHLTQTFFDNLPLLLCACGMVFMISLITGIYPALIISGFKPVNSLKGKLSSGFSGQNLFKKSLIIFQFSISIGVLIVMIVVKQQVDFMKNSDIGFNKDHLLNISTINWNDKGATFKNEVEKIAGVEKVTISTWTPSDGSGYMSKIIDDPNKPGNKINLWYISGDVDLSKTLDLKLIKGRFLSDEYGGDVLNDDSLQNVDWGKYEKLQETRPCIITASTAKILHITKLNQPIASIKAVPVGIIKDFHNESLKESLKPTIIFANKSPKYGNMMIKVGKGSSNQVSKSIAKLWKSFYPSQLLDLNRVDEMLNQQYKEEQKLQKLFAFFSGLSMLLACLGVFALIVHAAQQRIKEIGIRKVLGASVFQISNLLSKDFLQLVLIAIVIASPIAWYAMHTWLQGFAYRISIEWWVFVLAGMLAVVIAFATVSFQAIKAALANPIKSLRTE
jgi:putative ABC transport system permease protein